MPAPQGQSSNEMEEKVVEETPVLTVKQGKKKFDTPVASPKSSPGSSPRRSVSDKDSPINFIPEAAPRKKVPDRADAGSQSEDGQQVDAKLEKVRQEDDLDDSSPLKSTLDSPPPPSSTSVSTNPFGDEFDSEDDGQKESRVEGSVGGKQEEHGYAITKLGKKLPKRGSGSDSGLGDQNFTQIRRSVSEETVFSPPWDREESEKSVRDRLRNVTGTPSTGSPSLFTDDSRRSLLQDFNDSDIDGNDIKKTKRSPLRAKYAVQRASFVIPMVSAAVIAIYTIAYATSVYLQDKRSLIAFIINNPQFTTVPGLIALSLFAIGIFCAIKQFNNTIEHQIDEKDPDKILKKVLKPETEGQILRHLAVVHSNGTILHYRFNTWEANKNGIANVDEEVIRKVGKIESVINDRPVFTALSTGFIVANLALPLWLYAAGGISNVTTFYQSILATNTGLLSLVATGMFVLSILYLGVCNYKQTSCTNVVYLKDSETSNEKVNDYLLNEVVEQRKLTLKECHDQTGKIESLHVTKLVARFYDRDDLLVKCC